MGQTADKLAQVSQQTPGTTYNSPRLAENRRRLKFVESFGRELKPLLAKSVDEGFTVGVDKIEQLCSDFQLPVDEHDRLKQQVTDFAPKFSSWFSKRFSNALAATVSIDSRYSEQVMNNDLARLLGANAAQIHLQNALHAAFDTAIRNYKLMIRDAELVLDTKYQDWGVDIILARTNPANISLMMFPLLERLSVSDSALWIADRTFHTQIFLKLSEFYREVILALEKMSQSQPVKNLSEP